MTRVCTRALQTMSAYTKALKEYYDFTIRGIIPERLKERSKAADQGA